MPKYSPSSMSAIWLAIIAIVMVFSMNSLLKAATEDSSATPALAQTDPPSAQSKETAGGHSESIESHISEVKNQLEISNAQSAQWDAFCRVERENAVAVAIALKERDAMKSGTAIDELKSYARITQTRATSVQRMIPVFQALYDSMTPHQKKNADQVLETTLGARDR
jgi:periplasmic protein CpxP/Spy